MTRQTTLQQATADERTILNTARKLFTDSDLPSKPVRLIGIGVSNWEKITDTQPDLFTPDEQITADRKILETIDTVTEKFGKPVLQVGMPKTRQSD